MTKGLSQSETLTVVLGTASGVIRDAIREALKGRPDFQLLGDSKDWQGVELMLQQKIPDMLLLSSVMPGMSDPHVLKALSQIALQTKLVLFLRPETPPDRLRALLAFGPRAIIPTEMHMTDLMAVLGLVKLDMVVLPASMASLQHRTAAFSNRAGPAPSLSRRERELLELLAQGLSEKEAALRLGIGLRTVHTYLERLRGKLGAASRIHAISIALTEGLISMGNRDQTTRDVHKT